MKIRLNAHQIKTIKEIYALVVEQESNDANCPNSIAELLIHIGERQTNGEINQERIDDAWKGYPEIQEIVKMAPAAQKEIILDIYSKLK